MIAAPTPIRAPSDSPQPASVGDGQDWELLPLLFRDGLDRPIANLTVIVTLPTGEICEGASCTRGSVTVPMPPQAQGQARVEVMDEAGQRQPVCSIDLTACQGASAVVIASLKVKVDLPLRPHQPPAAITPAAHPAPGPVHQTAKAPAAQLSGGKTEPARLNLQQPWWHRSLEAAWAWLSPQVQPQPQPKHVPATPMLLRTRNSLHQPLSVVVGPECPNPQRLKLGRNNVYREAIQLAAQRLGLIPQAICALIDCEAAKVTERLPLLDPATQKPLTDKTGKPKTVAIRELWDANSGNHESGAAGLTQFLASTWLAHVLIPGRYIHEQSIANGWVQLGDVLKPVIFNGQVVSKVVGKHWLFVLADGTTTATPYNHRHDDANVKRCLAMRMDPTWSIMAAADYGNANLALLRRKGFKIDALSDMDKAKLMYLMHHEGEGAGPAFITNTLGEMKRGKEGLRKVFETQIGAAEAANRIEACAGLVEVAYRRWLADYVDKKFAESPKYFCSFPAISRSLSDVLEVVGGAEVAEP